MGELPGVLQTGEIASAEVFRADDTDFSEGSVLNIPGFTGVTETAGPNETGVTETDDPKTGGTLALDVCEVDDVDGKDMTETEFSEGFSRFTLTLLVPTEEFTSAEFLDCILDERFTKL